MEQRILKLAKRRWPELKSLGPGEQAAFHADVVGILYAIPFLTVGFVWLISVTDLSSVAEQWSTWLAVFALLFTFRQLDFLIGVEITRGNFLNFGGSLETIVSWSAALILGPSALWLPLPLELYDLFTSLREARSIPQHGSQLRNTLSNLGGGTFASLIALGLYQQWGGTFPPARLARSAVMPALLATGVDWIVSVLIMLPFLIYFARSNTRNLIGDSPRAFIKFSISALSWPIFVQPFGVLAAGLYAQNGLGGYLFFIASSLLTALLTHELSETVESAQQRSRELKQLEQLSRAILDGAPDASSLPAILREHVSTMFLNCMLEIRIFPDQILLRHPADGFPIADDRCWQWAGTIAQANCFKPGDQLPWQKTLRDKGLVVAPILDVEHSEAIGAICLTRHRNPQYCASVLPAIQSLAAQVASALHNAQVYRQTLEHQKVTQELALAGEIQTSFLPTRLPEVPGWQISAALEPARETSGDFYDLVPLPNNRLGILVADVADKGTAAALYMALSRTLIRTYAIQYHTRPDYVFKVANRRILMDTENDLFVTVFYGVLDPAQGTLTYCNAGHNPPFLVSPRNGHSVTELYRTGVPLGMFEEQSWQQKSVQMAPGDVLLLYTDGITEAQDAAQTFFGPERLLQILKGNMASTATEIQQAILTAVHTFVGDAPQLDDITLGVVVRQDERA